MPKPVVSVLAIAYNRREFINAALLSAINQTLPKDMYEIVLLTNFDIDPTLLSQANIRVVFSNIRELGPKLSTAIPLCQGDIICFLEDDDEWLPDKLEHVTSIFSKFPEVGYYHNNWIVIDERGNELPHPIHVQGRRRLNSVGSYSFNAKTATYSQIRKAVHLTGDFNGSSISIKKEIVQNCIGYLRQITFSPDTFFFYCAQLSDCRLFLDSTVLTKYRIHHKNVSRREAGSEDAISDPTHEIIVRMLSSHLNKASAIKSIRCQMSDIRIESFWIYRLGNRSAIPRLALAHTKYISRSELGYNILLLAFSILYFIFPGFASSIYSRAYY